MTFFKNFGKILIAQKSDYLSDHNKMISESFGLRKKTSTYGSIRKKVKLYQTYQKHLIQFLIQNYYDFDKNDVIPSPWSVTIFFTQ